MLVGAALVTMLLVPYLPTSAALNSELRFLQEQNAPVVLAYAGFAGCGDTCPRGLASLAEIYKQNTSTSGPAMELLFINVARNTPVTATQAFARGFHEEFNVYTISADDADDVYDELSLVSYDDDGQAAYHSDFVYLFMRQSGRWRIEKVYRRFPTHNRVLADLQALPHAI